MTTEFTKTDTYDCGECPGYCCSYPETIIGPTDIKRLAKGLGITEQDVEENYVRQEGEHLQYLKHTPDTVLGVASCVFLDKETRMCKVHGFRPFVCRKFPNGHGWGDRCDWWDKWTAESGRKVVIMKEMPGLILVS